MQDNIDTTTLYKKEPKIKKIVIGIICLCLGLVIGVGGTAFYYFDLLEGKLDDSENQQSDLESKLDSLTDELDSLDSEVEQLTYYSSDDDSESGVTIIESSSYSDNIQSVAEAVMPSVVGVRTITVQEATSYFMDGRGGGTQEVEGVGTGVIVSEDGLILTNQHVVSDDPKSITVTLMDGSEYDATIIYSDEAMDLAVIKIDATGLTAVELGDSDEISVGEVTIAIGNPLGLDYERSVTAGIVSALDRSIQLEQYSFATNLIQTDAAINSGNSGGPLLNAQGEVIGINTYKLSDGEGMGFAIPISAAIPIIEQVVETGEFTQAKLGVSFVDTNIYDILSDMQLQQLGIDSVDLDEGLLVIEIDEDSYAYTSGLQTNDILIYADGKEVNTLLELRTIIYGHLPGDTIDLVVLRGGETTTISVTLSESN